MKKIAAIFLMLFVTSTVLAQPDSPGTGELFHFAKKVSVDKSAGKQFRYEMAVQSTRSDKIPALRFYGVAAGKSGEFFKDKLLQVEKRNEQDWTIFTLIGRFPEEASYVWFFTSVADPGTYYFDDINLYVEESRGSWQQMDIANPSFEEKSNYEVAGYAIMSHKSGNPKTTLSQRVYKTGKSSLMITLSEEKTSKHLVAGE